MEEFPAVVLRPGIKPGRVARKKPYFANASKGATLRVAAVGPYRVTLYTCNALTARYRTTSSRGTAQSRSPPCSVTTKGSEMAAPKFSSQTPDWKWKHMPA